MLPNVEALGRQLVVDGPLGDDLPWPAIEEKWEIAFPDDYKEFLGLYGAGTFAGYLAVMAPFPEDHEAYKAGIRMAPPDSELLDELCCPFPAHPAPGGVFAIGATPGGDTLLYRTAQQPADWRIVTWSRDRRSPEKRWTEHELGFADFLLALLHAQLEEVPFGTRVLWGTEAVSYRRWDATRY